MNYFSLNEILFLLCRNSYNVDYGTFENNFKNVNDKKLEDLFKEVSNDPDLQNLLEYFNINLDYFERLKKADNLNFAFKKDGDIISNSKCGIFHF